MNGNPNRIPSSETATCPGCKASIVIHTHRQARYVGCPECSTLYRYVSKNLVHQQKWDGASLTVLKLGMRANFEKGNYVLTGIAVKSIPEYSVQWTEYTFFHPLHGYISMSENQGHWMMMEVVRDYPRNLTETTTSIYFRNEVYSLINNDHVRTIYAIGEFPSKVHEKIIAKEYIHPPYLIAREKQSDNVEWYFGKYVEPSVVASYFKETISLPVRVGVGAAQPSKYTVNSSQLKIIWGVFAVVFIVFAMILHFSSPKSVLFYTQVKLPADAPAIITSTDPSKPPIATPPTSDATQVPIVSNSFEITGSKPVNVDAHFEASVSNDWVYAECYLVNEGTGETRVFWQDIEYYHGVTDGESWSEGSQSVSKTLSSVPPGRYHLNFLTKAGSTTRNHLDITLVSGENIISNFWVCLAIFSILPLILMLRNFSFEKKRWMNSDYSSYTNNE